MSGATGGVTHIAGLSLHVGCLVRQRCGWCGAVLEDYNVHNIAFRDDDPDPRPPTWEVGSLVLVDGNLTASVAHEDGADLPDNACAVLDPAVTL